MPVRTDSAFAQPIRRAYLMVATSTIMGHPAPMASGPNTGSLLRGRCWSAGVHTHRLAERVKRPLVLAQQESR